MYNMKSICEVFMIRFLLAFTFLLIFGSTAYSSTCEGFGPQAPRDLTKVEGTNGVLFDFAPALEHMHLCNIHFHKNAEHKAIGFSLSGGKGNFSGWKCNGSNNIKKEYLKPINKNFCENINHGDSIEVHWVHSSCDVEPGKGLDACLPVKCVNPQIRVETKVFLVVNDSNALDFTKFDSSNKTNQFGYHQALSLPNRSDAIQFLGSSTGPQYTEHICSPLHVTWNVSQSCSRVDINSLSKWCASNKFAENKAHGVRQIVTAKGLLSKIQK